MRQPSPTRQTSIIPQAAKSQGLKLCSLAAKPEYVAVGLGNDGPELMRRDTEIWPLFNKLYRIYSLHCFS